MNDDTPTPFTAPVPRPEFPVDTGGELHWNRRVMISASLLSLLAACGGGSDDPPAPTPAPPPGPAPTPPSPPPAPPGPPKTLTVLAGAPSGAGTVDGVALAARFSGPVGIARDGDSLYVADTNNNLIRRIVIATQAVTTLAGNAQFFSGDGVGAAAGFSGPAGIAADGAGNLYVSDSGNQTIRKIVIATGAVTTIAGTVGMAGSTDGIGAAVRFNAPTGLAADGLGNLFVADRGNQTIRRIVLATGTVTTLAGTAGLTGTTNGIGAAARFNTPVGLASDAPRGFLYVADSGNTQVRRIVVATGDVTLFAGSSAGYRDGIGTFARFRNMYSLTCNAAGDIFVADTIGQIIRRINGATAEVTTLAGPVDNNSTGFVDGVGVAARFNFVQGIVVDGTGANLYLSDSNNNAIRKVTTDTATVTTFAGPSAASGSSDGTGTAARFNVPTGLASDGAGNLYVADRSNTAVRKVTIATGAVTTLVGGPGMFGNVNGTGAAVRFGLLNGLGSDGTNIYVADSSNQAVRRIVISTGEVTTFAGSTTATPGFSNGVGNAAMFSNLNDVASDGADNLFVADLGNQTIRRIVVATMAVTTLAGNAGASGSADAIGVAAGFASPAGVCADNAGNVYVCDRNNHTIRKIVVATGAVTTLAGMAGQPGIIDGTGATARFNEPLGIATDNAGNLYVSEPRNSAIRKIVIATGAVTTLVGKPGRTGVVPGLLSVATLNSPAFLKVIAGKLYATDTVDNVVVQIDL